MLPLVFMSFFIVGWSVSLCLFVWVKGSKGCQYVYICVCAILPRKGLQDILVLLMLLTMLLLLSLLRSLFSFCCCCCCCRCCKFLLEFLCCFEAFCKDDVVVGVIRFCCSCLNYRYDNFCLICFVELTFSFNKMDNTRGERKMLTNKPEFREQKTFSPHTHFLLIM